MINTMGKRFHYVNLTEIFLSNSMPKPYSDGCQRRGPKVQKKGIPCLFCRESEALRQLYSEILVMLYVCSFDKMYFQNELKKNYCLYKLKMK